MITMFILFLVFALCGRILGFAFKVTWNVAKFFLFCIFLPAILVMTIVGGLLSIAWPVLVVIGIACLVKRLALN